MGFPIPTILVDLLAFQVDNAINDYYSESFELIIHDKYELKTLSKNLFF